jgi:hypothetical protein
MILLRAILLHVLSSRGLSLKRLPKASELRQNFYLLAFVREVRNIALGAEPFFICTSSRIRLQLQRLQNSFELQCPTPSDPM